MKVAVICFCTSNYAENAKVALYSFKKQYPNAEYILDCEDTLRNYVPHVPALGACNWCSERFKVFEKYNNYDRVILIDSDMVAVGNIDLLFSEELNEYDIISTKDYGAKHYYPKDTKEYEDVLNAGMLILNKSFLNSDYMDKLSTLKSYNGTDQGYYTDYIHKFHPKWYIIPVKYNYCLDNYYPKEDDKRVIHYTGYQPLGEHFKRIQQEMKNGTK